MKGEADFSDKWFRSNFRSNMGRINFTTYGEGEADCHRRVANHLKETGVVLSSSGKMAYDKNLKSNNLTNMYWPLRSQFVDWARVNAPEVIKKRGAKPTHKGRVTTPAPKPQPKPKTTGWDDFDWSR